MVVDGFGKDELKNGEGEVGNGRKKTSARYGLGSNQIFDLESTNLQCICK